MLIRASQVRHQRNYHCRNCSANEISRSLRKSLLLPSYPLLRFSPFLVQCLMRLTTRWGSHILKYHEQDVGYNYVNIDDCYSEKKRNATGDIIARKYFGQQLPLPIRDRGLMGAGADKKRFPSGMKALTDEIHALGM